MTDKTDKDYLFDKNQAELERLKLIEKAYDPITQRLLRKIGLGPGLTCLEIGPGAGGIMDWLCEQTGASGRVTAIDLNPRFLDRHKFSNLTLINGDVAKEEWGQDRFDIVHARYVFIHLPDSLPVLQKIYRAVKPGGWLLLEDPDFTRAKAETGDAAIDRSFLKVREAIERMFSSMKLDPRYGSKLPDLLSQVGFTGIQTEISRESSPGGSVIAEFMKKSTFHLRETYLQTGAVAPDDLDEYCRLTEDPRHFAVYYESISCWGQKPGPVARV